MCLPFSLFQQMAKRKKEVDIDRYLDMKNTEAGDGTRFAGLSNLRLPRFLSALESRPAYAFRWIAMLC